LSEFIRLSYSDEERELLRPAMGAVGWAAGTLMPERGGGFNTLTVRYGDDRGLEIGGRPSFPRVTQETIEIHRGQHRRHVLAWHDLKKFVSRAYSANPDMVISTIQQVASYPDALARSAFAEAFRHVGKGVVPDSEYWYGEDIFDHHDWLKVGLFVMNGNPRNLWAGKGRINSAINTAQMHMNDALRQVGTMNDLVLLVNRWWSVQAGEVYTEAVHLAADVLDHAMRTIPFGPGYVGEVTDRVGEWVVRNLEVDALENRESQRKWDDLQDAILAIHGVASGRIEIHELSGPFLQRILTEFMTYMST
jgi:hypothetical protein